MTSKIDLHIHSNYSDGHMDLAEIFEEARHKGLSLISITDHDCIDAQEEAAELAGRFEIRYLPGVELSVSFAHPDYRNRKPISLDFRGYRYDRSSAPLLKKLNELRSYREKRATKILANINRELTRKDLTPLTAEDLKAIQESVDGAFGRPHIANYLVQKGIVADRQAAFDQYLVKCNVPKMPLSLEEASELIRGAGGKIVLAHPNDPRGTSLVSLTPSLEEQQQIIRAAMLPHIDGVECWHSRQDPATTQSYVAFAGLLGLIVTGGSDCHQQPVLIGGVDVPAEVADSLDDCPDRPASNQEESEVPLMIDHLLNPASLPDKTRHVSIVQTHISMVIVADEYVYKIKKRVDFGFLDFSSLSKRRHYCHQEVKLNQRLAPDVYLGVLSILPDDGGYRMEADAGQANVVEYAVRMKRIPEDVLMKSVFDKGALRDDHLKEIAAVLAGFHNGAQRSTKIDEFGAPRAFRINTDENFEQTKKYIGITIDKADFESLSEWTAAFYVTKGDLFQARIAAQKIRDCHGDLHMEHVCLLKPVTIIDCIEFNERFRYTDTIADIAFLLMDLEYRDGGAFAESLWTYYQASASETGMDALLTFYKVYRAYVRGKVISFQLDDEHIDVEAKQSAALAAKKYFKLARSYIERA